MDARTEEYMDPDQAKSIMERSGRMVRQSRNWHMVIMLATGLATIAFFALIGWVSQEHWARFEIFILMVPMIFYMLLVSIRRRHPTTGSRELLRLEARVLNAYLALLIVSIATCIFVLQPGTIFAASIGILPALPCFYGAWRVWR